MDLDEAGERMYGGEANTVVAFQTGQLRYIIQYHGYMVVYDSIYLYFTTTY